eukprot:4006936-Alexandrium_andersonii.AAC.1
MAEPSPKLRAALLPLWLPLKAGLGFSLGDDALTWGGSEWAIIGCVCRSPAFSFWTIGCPSGARAASSMALVTDESAEEVRRSCVQRLDGGAWKGRSCT